MMQTVMIVGAGKGGMAMIEIFQDSIVLDVQAVIDLKAEAPGILWRRKSEGFRRHRIGVHLSIEK